MDQRANRTFICSVLFLDIVEYSKKSVEEQIGLKVRFNALLSEIIKDIAVNDRFILDTGDGVAIGFPGDPEDALFVAMELRDSVQNEQPGSSPPLSIRMGINLGPVKLVMDINKQLTLIGDGINVAQRVMSFSQPKQLLVSRSYFEVISCLSQEYAKLFDYQGLHADKHVREHGIYAVGHYESKQDSVSGVRSRRNSVVKTNEVVQELRPQPGESCSTDVQASGRVGATPVPAAVLSLLRRKWFYAAVPLAVIMLLLGAVFLHRSGSPTKPGIVTTVPQPAVATVASSNTKQAENSRSTALPEAEADLVSINFRILPWGEIYINGKKKGVSPPLVSVKLKPGKYSIEIKNSSFPTYSQTVDAKSKGNIEIKHKFQ
jgi:class 3 adenylate cyclase